jgi:hypothetical protein
MVFMSASCVEMGIKHASARSDPERIIGSSAVHLSKAQHFGRERGDAIACQAESGG